MALTTKQEELLQYIQETVGHEGRMPSFREMAKAMGVSAVGTIQDHMRALMDKGFVEKDENSGKIRLTARVQTPVLQIPFLGRVAAGPLQEAIETCEESFPLPLDFLGPSFKSRKNLKPRDLFALEVYGESMKDAAILPGDYVIVDTKAHVKNGDFVVARVEGETTLKEIRFPNGKSNALVELVPHNKKLKTIEVSQDQLEVLGKVVSLTRFGVNVGA